MLGDRAGDPARPFVEGMPARAGLMTLVANTYVNYLLDREMRAREFDLLARIVGRVPLGRVNPHEDPANLSTLCETILKDFETLTCTAFPTTGG